MYTKAYVPPTVTVDGVIFQIDNDKLTVLVIKRANEPFKGEWALPGGYVAAGETTVEGFNRVLSQKAGVGKRQLDIVEQLYTFDAVARDPRGHAVSIAYMGLGRNIEPSTDENAQSPHFFFIDALPKLAYDHKKIIEYALERLRNKVLYTNIIFALLPEQFTHTELQTAYEAVLNKKLDKRNFRKKIALLGFIEETNELRREGAHRPARLCKFRVRKLQTVAHTID